MPDIEALLWCPVCAGVKMAKIRVGREGRLLLDHCTRCGGVWFDHGEVDALRELKPRTLLEQINPPSDAFRSQCRHCRTRMDRNADICPACRRPNVLACPVCGKDVELVKWHDHELDVCWNCQGMWLDAVEVAALWNAEARRLKAPAAGLARAGRGTEPRSGSFLFDAFDDPFVTLWAIDAGADVAAAAGHGLVSALSHADDLVEALPGAAGAVVEGTSELAGSVFEVVANILEGIFDIF